MGSRILVVEDDELIGASLARALTVQGYDVDRAVSISSARQAVAGRRPDLVLCDLGLPDGDGLELCAELSRQDPTLPVMVLTARAEEVDLVVGLGSGAVDYVTKPFRLAELQARVAAHLRTAARHGAAATDGDHIQVGDLDIDARSRRVHLSGQEVDLRPKEFDLLVRLGRDAGRVVSREALMSDVWDIHWSGSTKTLDVHLNALRRKLGEEPGTPSRITAIRGVGFRLDPR